MAWCEYCVDRSSWLTTCYKCIRKGKEDNIPDGYVKWYCSDGNAAYSKCPIYNRWYITTATSNILSIDKKSLNSLMKLKDYFHQDKKYDSFVKIYDIVGPIIAYRLLTEKDNGDKARIIYSRLEKVVESANKLENEEAAKKYIMMTLRLVCEYGLHDIYRDVKQKRLKNS